MVILSGLLGATAPALSEESSGSLLNSERIEQRFGSYGIKVMQQDEQVRVASLYSLESSIRVTRTFAVTRFPDSIDPRLASQHEKILSGGSIGAVFTDAGWEVSRRHLWLGELPATAGIRSMMGDTESGRLAVNIFDLVLSRDGERRVYASITEVHHPDHLTLSDLEQLYSPIAVDHGDRAAELLMLTLNRVLQLQVPDDRGDSTSN